MSDPVWPETLPQPLRGALSERRIDTRRRRPSELPPQSYTRRASGLYRAQTLAIVCTPFQRGVLDDFYDRACDGGTRVFRMPDPTRHEWPLADASGAPLLGTDGAPLFATAIRRCLWGAEPMETARQRGISFTLQFEVLYLP